MMEAFSKLSEKSGSGKGNRFCSCYSFFFLLTLLFIFLSSIFVSEARATPGSTFPPYMQNSLVVRITGCALDWLKRELNLIFVDDGVASSGDELCPPGQHLGGGSFSGGYVPCAWKTLNFINAILMDFLDQNTASTSQVQCCCDPAKDSTNCTGPVTTGCPTQFPNRGKCTDLKPEATNYYVISGFEAWTPVAVTNTSPVTEAWKGLLDQCLSIPLMGQLCINLSLNDVCAGGICGPPAGWVANSNTGYCAYPPYVTAGDTAATACGGIYQSQNRDRFILDYNPNGGIQVNFNVGQSTNSCGMGPAGYSYNGKTFTGNEGFLTIDLQIGSAGKPVRIDIDAVTPSMGSRLTFPVNTFAPGSTRVAPGKTDCDPDMPGHQGNCYVRAYLQATGALKISLGATAYLEHRTDQFPHMQDVGLAIRSIDFSNPPWISLQLDWKWTETTGSCTNTNVCRRKEITDKATKLLPFIDLVLRGLFRYDFIPAGIRQYFGPLVLDITDLVRPSITHIAPTWSRPINTDSIQLDISAGGDPVAGSQILRSKSCYAQTGVGPTAGPRDEIYLIASGMIDLDLFRNGYANNVSHLVPSCGYQGSPTHPAFTPAPNPTQFSQLPHAGSRDSVGLTSCEGSGTFIGISLHQNVFSYLVSDIAASGIMCLALSKQGEGFASSLPLPIYTVGQFKMVMPELYDFLESEFGSGVTDIPIIFVLKPKPNFGEVAGFPQVPQASLIDDTPPNSWNPLPITGDVLLTLPNNDFEIWIDVDKKIEQWGYGPGDNTPGACSYSTVSDATNWCNTFGSATTPPARWWIDRPPAGGPGANDFINNFPDCVSFIDCDTTIGDPADRTQERRFLGQFNVGITLGLDLNFYGCGRASGKVFSNLPAYGFSTTWYNPWNPSTAGNCTTVSHLRRIDLTLGLVSRVGSFDIYNDARGTTTRRVYYPFSNGTFQGYIADFVGVLLSSALAIDAQVGYTLSPILDPADDLYSATPANNRVIRLGGHTAGGTADRLTHSYIARDDVGNLDPDPAAPYQQSFLTIAIDLQGLIHPNFIYNLISGLLGGQTTLFAPPYLGLPKSIDTVQANLLKIYDAIQNVLEGKEVFISTEKIKELVKRVEEGGYVVPRNESSNLVEDLPPETIVEEVSAHTSRTIIKLSCVDDTTPAGNCWYSWRWPGKMWFNWTPNNEIEFRGLPDGVYEIEVRALDEMALPDITPEKVVFVIDDNAPSIFTPRKSSFKKNEFMRIELWDYITEPKDILISWKIESKNGNVSNNGSEMVQIGVWSEWYKPDKVEDGRGVKFIRLPNKEGDYKITLRAKDNKGNTEEKVFNFKVEGNKIPILSCISSE